MKVDVGVPANENHNGLFLSLKVVVISELFAIVGSYLANIEVVDLFVALFVVGFMVLAYPYLGANETIEEIEDSAEDVEAVVLLVKA